MLGALRDDALRSTDGGFLLHLSLPWIRSLPLSGLVELAVEVDGRAEQRLQVLLGDRTVAPADLAHEPGWWFLQDRVVLRGGRSLPPGRHDVSVAFDLVVPYLQAGSDGPLHLPFRFDRTLTQDSTSTLDRTLTQDATFTQDGTSSLPTVSRRRLSPEKPTMTALSPSWTLTASAFNWTPEVIRAESSAADIAVGIASGGIASVIEVELGQLWRSFPAPSDAEAESLRDALAAAGGRVSIVGASIDDWASPTRRRDDAERLSFLLPQLRAARRLGAAGIRLPIGQAGTALLEQLLPILHDLDLVLYEEAQGPQSPSAPAHRNDYDAIARIDDPHLRLLIDISMLMPALPVTYLDRLRESALPADFVDRLENEWCDPEISAAAVALLRADAVPPEVHTMFMNLLVRFGRSDAGDLRHVLPLVGAAHLKFWDLDDADGRLSQPIREFATQLRSVDFTGTLTSEWGGHEWLDGDATDMTQRHLELAQAALTV